MRIETDGCWSMRNGQLYDARSNLLHPSYLYPPIPVNEAMQFPPQKQSGSLSKIILGGIATASAVIVTLLGISQMEETTPINEPISIVRSSDLFYDLMLPEIQKLRNKGYADISVYLPSDENYRHNLAAVGRISDKFRGNKLIDNEGFILANRYNPESENKLGGLLAEKRKGKDIEVVVLPGKRIIKAEPSYAVKYKRLAIAYSLIELSKDETKRIIVYVKNNNEKKNVDEAIKLLRIPSDVHVLVFNLPITKKNEHENLTIITYKELLDSGNKLREEEFERIRKVLPPRQIDRDTQDLAKPA